MTTEDGPSVPDGRARVVTRLPSRGSVLVRSPSTPVVPGWRCVDVRPGPFATFDGDRFRSSLSVRSGGEHRRFDRWELAAVEDAIAAFLGDGEPADGKDSPPTASSDRDPPPVDTDDRSGVAGPERPVVAEDGLRVKNRDGGRVFEERRVVRFGDRAACRRLLPDAAVDSIERRLGAAASRASAALLTWTSDEPRTVDHRSHDVVLDRPMTGRD